MCLKNNIKIVAIEAIQSIQNLSNEIDLLAGKSIHFRVFVNGIHKKIQTLISAEALITLSQDGSVLSKQQNSLNSIRIHENHQDLDFLRSNWDSSINFYLDRHNFEGFDLDAPIDLKFELTHFKSKANTYRVHDAALDGFSIHKRLQPSSHLSLKFVGYRNYYSEKDIQLIPSIQEHYETVGLIEEMFPVSSLECSNATIDVPRDFFALRSVLVNSKKSDEKVDRLYTILFKHLLAVRTQDLSQELQYYISDQADVPNGVQVENRSNPIYVGLLNDPSSRFGGAAMMTPEFPSSNMVAIAEPDDEGLLAAHEIGHLLGLEHPGIPNKEIHGRFIGQSDQVDRSGAYNPRGYISLDEYDPLKIVYGLDSRRSARNPTILKNNENFDFMTYRYPQWISKYSYDKLYTRLREIDRTPDCTDSNKRYLNVIGDFDFINHTGTITFVLNSSFDSSLGRDSEVRRRVENSRVKLILVYSGDDVISSTELANCIPGSLKQTVDGTSNCVEKGVLINDRENADTNSSLGVFIETIVIESGGSISEHLPEKILLTIDEEEVDVRFIKEPISFIERSDYLSVISDKRVITLNESANVSFRSSSEDRDKKQENDEYDGVEFSLKYSLDKDAFYFNYHWGVSGDVDSPHVAVNRLVKSMLNYLIQSNVTITTTVQFKKNIRFPKDEIGDSSSVNSDRDWHTVLISNRLIDSAWISSEFAVEVKQPSLHDRYSNHKFVNEISQLDCIDYSDLGIEFRILLTVGGYSIQIFESSSEEGIPSIVPRNRKVVLEAMGSLGVEKLGYASEIDAQYLDKKYYKPGLDPERIEDC